MRRWCGGGYRIVGWAVPGVMAGSEEMIDRAASGECRCARSPAPPCLLLPATISREHLFLFSALAGLHRSRTNRAEKIF